MINEQDVIICALNEESTIGTIVSVFTHAPYVRTVNVLIDQETTDATPHIAEHYGAAVWNNLNSHGKGNLLSAFWSHAGTDLTPRVILSDADYTKFPPSIPSRLVVASKGMHLLVPKHPTLSQWHEWSFGRRVPFSQSAWALNTGLRTIPRVMLSLPLHGYLTETQLNKHAMANGMSVTHEYASDLISPLRFTRTRVRAMETDRAYGIEHGILKAVPDAK